jgi:elongation factor G
MVHGAIINDLISRGGRIDDHGRRSRSARLITAMVPAASLFGYASALRELTHGSANCAMQFDHYATGSAPDNPPFRPAIGMRI